jgi:hypothetical protein
MLLKPTNDLALDAYALVAALVNLADSASKALYSTEHEQESFISEFLVICEIGFGLFGVRCREDEALWSAVREESTRYDPKHLELLERRQQTYFNAMKATHDPVLALATTMANYTGSRQGVIPWAYDYFGKAMTLFMELVDPGRMGAKRTGDRNAQSQHKTQRHPRGRAGQNDSD